MKISILGLGYVGAVSLGCLVRDGHHVIGADIDNTKLDLIRQGKTPIIEEGMEKLMADVATSGRVEVTTDAGEAVSKSELSFVCVGTPSASNGGQDQTAIMRVAEQIGDALKDRDDYHVCIIRSTVAPGTVERLIKPILEQHSGKKVGVGFGLGFQPEFLREGSSIKDYDNPPFTVVGGDSERTVNAVKEVFEHLPGQFISTSIGSAEMLKYCCNVFHALKTTFANEIGRLCQSLNVDSHEVMDLVCQDKQLNISRAYMRPGFAFGGSCLPKDLRALVKIAQDQDVQIPMLSQVMPSNRIHIEHALQMVLSTGERAVGMIGLSFKSGTDDLRESPLVTIAEQFIGKGLHLNIYDPEVNIARLLGANKRYIEESIPHIGSIMLDDCEKLIEQSKVIVVGLSNPEVLEVIYQRSTPDHIIIDLVNIPHKDKIKSQYHGVCW